MTAPTRKPRPVPVPRQLPRRPAPRRRRGTRPASPPTRTDGSSSSRRAFGRRSSAGRCSSRPLSSAPGVSITRGPGVARTSEGGPPVPGARRSPRARRARRADPARGRAPPDGDRPPRRPTSRSRWPRAERGRRPAGVVRRHPTLPAAGPAAGPGHGHGTDLRLEFDPTDFPRPTTTGRRGSRARRARSSGCSRPALLEHPLGLLQQVVRRLPFPR